MMVKAVMAPILTAATLSKDCHNNHLRAAKVALAIMLRTRAVQVRTTFI